MMPTVRTDMVAAIRVPVILIETSRILYMSSETLCSSHCSETLKFFRHTLDCAEDPGNPVIAEAYQRGIVVGVFLDLLPRSKGSQSAVLDKYCQAELLELFGFDPLAEYPCCSRVR
jgi:hypothetical protein